MSTITTTGFKYPQAVISNGVITGNQWTNVDKMLLSDQQYGQSNPTPGESSDVILGNYNLNIPQNSVVTGIQIKLLGYRGPQQVPAITISPYAVDNTGPTGDNVYYPYTQPFEIPDEVDSTYVLGSSTYLYATSWTVDQINNFKVGLVANGEVYIDTVLVNVLYYVEDSVTPVVPSVDGCENCQMPIQVPPLRLALPFKVGDTKFTCYSFNYADGTPVNPTDLSECGLGYAYFTFDQGRIKQQGSNFMENARCYTWTTLANGYVEFDLVDVTNRGLGFKLTGAHDADLMSDHDVNSEVVLSDSVPMMANYVRRCQEGVVFSKPISVQSEDANIVSPATKLNFRGAGVDVIIDPSDDEKANIIIQGNGNSTPIVVNTSSGSTGTTPSTTLTWSHTSSGINRANVFQVVLPEGTPITGLTYNGVAATFIGAAEDNGIRVEQWILLAPTVGTYNVVVTTATAVNMTGGAECYVAVDQTTGFATFDSNTGTGNTPTLSTTTTVDNSIIVDALGTDLTPILYTVGAGQALNWSITANGNAFQGASSVELTGTAPASVTSSYSITQNTDWVITSFELIGLQAPAAGTLTVEDSVGVVDSDVNTIEFNNCTVTNPTPGKVVVTPNGGTGSGSELTESINQTAHGLTVGEVIGSNNTANEYQAVISSTSDNMPIGFVTTVTDVDNFIMSTSGFAIITASLLSAFSDGDVIWHSTSVSGGITPTKPTSGVKRKLGIVIDKVAGKIYIDIDTGFVGSGSSSITGSISQQQLDFTGSSTQFIGGCYDSSKDALHLGFRSGGTNQIFTYIRNSVTGMYELKSSVTPPTTYTSASFVIIGSYFYDLNSSRRYDITPSGTINNPTAITFSGFSGGFSQSVVWTDGTDLYVTQNAGGAISKRLTISGTVLTQVSTSVCSGNLVHDGNVNTFYCNTFSSEGIFVSSSPLDQIMKLDDSVGTSTTNESPAAGRIYSANNYLTGFTVIDTDKFYVLYQNLAGSSALTAIANTL